MYSVTTVKLVKIGLTVQSVTGSECKYMYMYNVVLHNSEISHTEFYSSHVAILEIWVNVAFVTKAVHAHCVRS